MIKGIIFGELVSIGFDKIKKILSSNKARLVVSENDLAFSLENH